MTIREVTTIVFLERFEVEEWKVQLVLWWLAFLLLLYMQIRDFNISFIPIIAFIFLLALSAYLYIKDPVPSGSIVREFENSGYSKEKNHERKINEVLVMVDVFLKPRVFFITLLTFSMVFPIAGFMSTVGHELTHLFIVYNLPYVNPVEIGVEGIIYNFRTGDVDVSRTYFEEKGYSGYLISDVDEGFNELWDAGRDEREASAEWVNFFVWYLTFGVIMLAWVFFLHNQIMKIKGQKQEGKVLQGMTK